MNLLDAAPLAVLFIPLLLIWSQDKESMRKLDIELKELEIELKKLEIELEELKQIDSGEE